MNRKIKLKRKAISRYGVPKDLVEEKVTNLGSFYGKNDVFRALSYEEEDKFMGDIVGLKPTDSGFRNAVTTFYKNLTIKVGADGVELEIGVDTAGNPLNILDFIKYRVASKSSETAKDKDECEALEHKKFYFEDLEADNDLKAAKLEVTAKAYVEFAKLDSDEDKMDWVIRTVITKFPTLGSLVELTALESNKKKLKIAEVIQKDPEYFLTVMADKDLIYKAEVASMVEANVLIKEGNKYLNGTENLGSLEGTIAWMKDGNNSQDYAILKARLDQFGIPLTVKVKTKSK